MKTGALSRSLLLALTGTACIALGQSAKPLWIDHLGMDSDFPRTVSGSANVENPFDLFFLDGQELIFSFDVNDTGGRMRTEPSTRVVTTVDTLTGSFLGRLRLPCPSGACRVAPTADGQLAVILGDKVEKLSRDFKELQEAPIPPCEPDSGKCSTTPPQIDVTPGDKEIVLQRFDAFKYVSEMNDRISVGGVEWLRLKTADLSWDKTSHGRWSTGSFSAGNHAVIESESAGDPRSEDPIVLPV